MKTVYRKKEGLLFKDLEDRTIVVSMNDNMTDMNSSMYTINRTCREIFELIDGEKSVSEIIINMAYMYDVSIEAIKDDIKSLFYNLKHRGLIIEV